MFKVINILGIITGLIMFISAAAEHVPVYFAVIGLILVAGSFFSDRSRAKRKDKKLNAQVQARIAQLTIAPWQDRETLLICTKKQRYLLSIFVLASCLWAIYFQLSNNVTNWLVLGLALLIGTFLSLNAIRKFSCGSKTFITFSKSGFSICPYAFIQWKDVEGITLEKNQNSGLKISILNIKINSYCGSIHWAEHLMSFIGLITIKKKTIRFSVKHLTEKPETVAAVAAFLWIDSTKKRNSQKSIGSE